VQGPGHCTACHTPKTFLGGDKSGDENLRGFNLQGWFAPDITGDVAQGLGQWSETDVTGYLKTGHNRITAATGPMAEEIVNSTSQYNDNDLQAIATYLKSLPARQDAAPARPDAASMKAGEAIYRDQCSACHGLDGKGVPMLFPSLAQSAMAHASDATSAIRLVLRGGRSVATDAEPTAPGMPSFGWQLDDAQVAAVVTYVRNAWQTAAAPVTADVVGKTRDQMRTRAD
jgi:mono/diheme cytochrome c family protein